MGPKSLGEQMGVDENDAACYIESFKSRYTGTLHLISFKSIIQFINNITRSRPVLIEVVPRLS